jgi:hypothetical protein
MDAVDDELLRPEIDALIGRVAEARFRHVAGIDPNPGLVAAFAAHPSAADRRTIEGLERDGEKGLGRVVAHLRAERVQAGDEEAWRAAAWAAEGRGPDGMVAVPRAQLAIVRERDRARRLAFGRAVAEGERFASRDAAIEKRALARTEVGLLPDWEAVVEADALLGATEDGYRDVLRWLTRREVELAPPPEGDLERADLLFALSLPHWSGLFPAGMLSILLERTLSAIGLDLRSVRVDDERRPAKWPGAHAFEHRVSLLRQGGPGDWLATFDAVGQAIASIHVAPHHRDPAAPATIGALLAGLLLDRHFLRTVLGVDRKDLGDLVRALALRQLFRLRTSAAGLRVASEVERGTSGATWYDAHREALTSAAAAVWPAGLWARDGDASAAAAHLRGAAHAELLRRSLVERFDVDWWRNPRTARELRSVLAHGVVLPGEAPKLLVATQPLVAKLQ